MAPASAAYARLLETQASQGLQCWPSDHISVWADLELGG